MRATHYGFTLAEILVVIGVMAMLVTMSVLAFSNFQHYFEFRAAVQDVETALVGARNATLAAKNDTVHGVHIEQTRVIRFVGPVYDSASSTNIIFVFPGAVTATSSLTDGVVDVVFTRLTGAAQKSGTITVTEPRSGSISTTTIFSSGLIGL